MLGRVTEAAFGQRRKMLRQSVKSLGGEALLAERRHRSDAARRDAERRGIRRLTNALSALYLPLGGGRTEVGWGRRAPISEAPPPPSFGPPLHKGRGQEALTSSRPAAPRRSRTGPGRRSRRSRSAATIAFTEREGAVEIVVDDDVVVFPPVLDLGAGIVQPRLDGRRRILGAALAAATSVPSSTAAG